MHPQGLPGSVSFELFSFTWIDHKHLSKPKQYHIVQYIQPKDMKFLPRLIFTEVKLSIFEFQSLIFYLCQLSKQVNLLIFRETVLMNFILILYPKLYNLFQQILCFFSWIEYYKIIFKVNKSRSPTFFNFRLLCRPYEIKKTGSLIVTVHIIRIFSSLLPFQSLFGTIC